MADFFKRNRSSQISWKFLNSKSWSQWCWMEHLCIMIYQPSVHLGPILVQLIYLTWHLQQFVFSWRYGQISDDLNPYLPTYTSRISFFQIIAPFHRVSLPICFGDDLHHDPAIFRKQFRCFKVLLEVVEGSSTGAHQLWRTLHLFSPIHHRTHAAHGSGFTRGSHLKAWRWPRWSPMVIWSDVEILFFEDKHVIEICFFGSFGEGHWSCYFSLLRFFWAEKPILDEGNSFLRSCWLGLVRFGRDFVDQSGD